MTNTLNRSFAKIALIIIFLSFFIVVFYRQIEGDIYPVTYVSIFLSTSLLSIVLLRGSPVNAYLCLGGAVFISLAYRLLKFDVMAISGGIDGEWFASQTYSILLTGGTEAIAPGFYQVIAGYPVLLALVSKISGLEVETAMMTIPLTIGVSIPLFVWVFSSWLVSNNWRFQCLAAVLAGITTFSMFHSWSVIAQSVTIPIFLASVLALYYLQTKKGQSAFLLLVITSLALASIHKITIVLFVTSAVFTFVFIHFSRVDQIKWKRSSVSYSVILVLIVILVVQNVLFTNHVEGIANFALGLIASEPNTVVEYSEAYNPKSGFLWTIATGVNMIGLLSIAGIGWFYGLMIWLKTRSDHWQILLPVSAVCVFTGIVMTIVGLPTRGLMIVEPILVVLVLAVLIWLYRQETRLSRTLSVIIIIVVIATQSFALIGMVDHPSQPDRHITGDEISAKEFALEYGSELPYTDSRYALHMTHPTQPESRYRNNWLDPQLLNGTVDLAEHSPILHRNRDVYDFRGGWYKLTWSPETYFNTKYDRVYSAGDAIYYQNSSAVHI